MNDFCRNLWTGWPWAAGILAVIAVLAFTAKYIPFLNGLLILSACVILGTWFIGWIINDS